MVASWVATYRLQLQPDFTFDDAAGVVAHVAALGVSHLYLSPCLRSASGSTHGYDVTDPRRLDEERGGREGFARLREALAEHGLGLVLDVVPNHMAASPENPAWRDLLELGSESPYLEWFDVDWTQGPITLPLLEGPLEEILTEGALRLARRAGGVVLTGPFGELPVGPASLADALEEAARESGSHELTECAREALSPEEGGLRALAQHIARTLSADPRAAAALDAALARRSSDPALLAGILGAQSWRLIPWRDAPGEISYRRFFDVNDLVGLRQEDPHVFQETHARVLEMVARGEVDGLRVDHVDGLLDPEGYLVRLRHAVPQGRIWVEKILAPGEHLPGAWPVDGTTGYALMRVVEGVLVDPDGEAPLTALHSEFTGEQRDFHTIAREKRLQALDELFPAELHRLAGMLAPVAERRFRPLSADEASGVLRETIAALGVYRTYVRPGSPVRPEDQRQLEAAVEEAAERRRDLDPRLFDFLRDVLLQRWATGAELLFTLRFQQLCPAVAAKGVEDTALYDYARLLALNEVGGDPAHFGLGVPALHRTLTDVQATHPATLFAVTTHDTKRSADVRARLLALSEVPERWVEAVRRWSEHNELRGQSPPDRGTEYALYQTLVGAWPLDVERARAVMLKSAREAKVHTSWLAPDEAYEEALGSSIERMLSDPWLLGELDLFVRFITPLGHSNALARTLVHLTAPGIPDLYQGTELWSLRLVDPDNRAPIDFETAARLREHAAELSPERLIDGMEAGLPKLHVVRRALQLRRRLPRAFGVEGDYEPVEARGPQRGHVIAFSRGGEVVTVVPRLVSRLGGDWKGTKLRLPGGEWRNELTGERLEGGEIELARLLERFPVALLARGEAAGQAQEGA